MLPGYYLRGLNVGKGSTETKVEVVQQVAQNQETNVGANKDLSATIDKLVGVLRAQAENPPSGTFAPTITTPPVNVTTPPVTSNVIPVFLQQPQVSGATQGQPYDNAAVTQLLANMYYNVLKGQQPVEDSGSAPVDLKALFIVVITIGIIAYTKRRK